MKITVTINDKTKTYLCKEWSMSDDMIILYTKPTVLYINNKETIVKDPAKTIYISKKNVDYMEIEAELE